MCVCVCGAVIDSECSTRTIDTDGEQDSHVTANCIGSCPVLSADRRKSKEKEAMVYQQDIYRVGLLSKAAVAASWSWTCPTAVESIP